MFTHLYHLTEFPLFLIETGVILLLLSKFRSCFEKGLEILWVSSVFEQVDLGQELLFLLLKLSDLLLEFCRVHTLIAKSLSILMDGLKLSLQVLIPLQGTSHLFIHHILIRNLEWYQKFGSISFSGQIWQTWNKPIKNMVACLFLTVNNVSAIVWVKIAWIA